MRQTNSRTEAAALWYQGMAEVQVQSEVVLFQGSLSRSGLDMLLTIACTLVTHVFRQRPDVNFAFPKWLFAIPLVFGLLGAVFSGWLADAKLGNYRVMKCSSVLLFLTSLLF